MGEGQAEMDRALRLLLSSGDYSDMTIQCGIHEYKVHRAVVCSRSTYFRAALKGGTFKEAKEGVITLKAESEGHGQADGLDADDPEAVQLMINFLYSHDYRPKRVPISIKDANEEPETFAKPKQQPAARTSYRGPPRAESSQAEPMVIPSGDCNTVMHAKMYALGDKYGIESLKAVALAKFAEAVTYAWNHANFVRTISLVFTTTPEHDKGLRNITTKAILDHQAVLSKKPEVEEIIKSIESLACDLWKGMAKTAARKGPTCDTCGNVYVRYCDYCGTSYADCDCALSSCPNGCLR